MATTCERRNRTLDSGVEDGHRIAYRYPKLCTDNLARALSWLNYTNAATADRRSAPSSSSVLGALQPENDDRAGTRDREGKKHEADFHPIHLNSMTRPAMGN